MENETEEFNVGEAFNQILKSKSMMKEITEAVNYMIEMGNLGVTLSTEPFYKTLISEMTECISMLYDIVKMQEDMVSTTLSNIIEDELK